MNYTTLIFDIDETLFDFKKTERVALKNTLLEFHIPYEESYHLPLYKTINKLLWDDLEKGLIQQETINKQRFINFKEALNATFDSHAFAESFMKHLGNGSYLLDGAEELITSIAPHYNLIILTNGLTSVQKSRLKKSPINNYFSHQFISAEIGIAKPNVKLYEYVFNTLNIEHHKTCLMIGDSLTSDIQGGINAGIDTCWVNLNGKENSSPLSPTYEVQTLKDLKTLLLAN